MGALFIVYGFLLRIPGRAYVPCYLQHLGAGTFPFANHLQPFAGIVHLACYAQHFKARTFHFTCFTQHFVVKILLPACYSICSIVAIATAGGGVSGVSDVSGVGAGGGGVAEGTYQQLLIL